MGEARKRRTLERQIKRLIIDFQRAHANACHADVEYLAVRRCIEILNRRIERAVEFDNAPLIKNLSLEMSLLSGKQASFEREMTVCNQRASHALEKLSAWLIDDSDSSNVTRNARAIRQAVLLP